MKPRQLNYRENKRTFHNLAGKTHKKNVIPGLCRGGRRE